jgi:BMFP domain-containing protein YqiC
VQNRLSEVQSAILSPVDVMKRFLGTAQATAPKGDEESEVDTLRKRVAELEARLNKPAGAKRKSNKSKKKR